jgi:hypothetical protein
MSFTGCIRGAIAFGLSMGIKASTDLNSAVLAHTTLILIFLTTIVCGAAMPFVFSHYRSREVEPEMSKALSNDEIEYELLRCESQAQEVKFASTGTYDYDFSHPNNKLLE